MVDWAEMATGFTKALHDFGAVLTPAPPWLWVVIGLFCGAWMVQFLDRLMQVLLFGWLRWIRRLWLLGFSGWCVFPGCGTRIKARYQLCHNHFLAASRYQWEYRDGWGKKDKQADAFWVYLLELDGGGEPVRRPDQEPDAAHAGARPGDDEDNGRQAPAASVVRAGAIAPGGCRERSRPETPDRHAAR